jgi:hypothetical protein
MAPEDYTQHLVPVVLHLVDIDHFAVGRIDIVPAGHTAAVPVGHTAAGPAGHTAAVPAVLAVRIAVEHSAGVSVSLFP